MFKPKVREFRCSCGNGYRLISRCPCAKKCPKCGVKNRPRRVVTTAEQLQEAHFAEYFLNGHVRR